MYQIKCCSEAEVDKLQLFIRKNIRENEFLAHDKDFLKWQYYDKKSLNYNFLIALHSVSNEIHGLYGFLPTYQFDAGLSEEKDIWTTNWVVNKEISQNNLGLKLIFHLLKLLEPKSFGGPGFSDTGYQLFKALKYVTGILNHYYILNKIIINYRIAANVNSSLKQRFNKEKISPIKLIEIDNIDNLKLNLDTNIRPKKSIEYVKNRYFAHPIYKYRFFIVKKDSKCLALFIVKKIFVNGSSCLRIVDILGDISYIKYVDYQYLLDKENSEYIDCLNHGINSNIFFSAGFQKRNDEIIVPEHFDPFEQRNFDVRYAYKCSSGNYVIFKGDGGLDRPGRIRKENEF